MSDGGFFYANLTGKDDAHDRCGYKRIDLSGGVHRNHCRSDQFVRAVPEEEGKQEGKQEGSGLITLLICLRNFMFPDTGKTGRGTSNVQSK